MVVRTRLTDQRLDELLESGVNPSPSAAGFFVTAGRAASVRWRFPAGRSGATPALGSTLLRSGAGGNPLGSGPSA
jgi:hypothetical protein